MNDLDYTALALQIYNHGLIDGISQNAATTDRPNRLPFYFPSSSFSLALVDILTTSGALASARNPLLITAEHADDAHTAAVDADGKQPSPQHSFLGRLGLSYLPASIANNILASANPIQNPSKPTQYQTVTTFCIGICQAKPKLVQKLHQACQIAKNPALPQRFLNTT